MVSRKRVIGRAAQGGITYLGVLLLIAVLSAGLAKVGEVWRTAAQREKEKQLLHIGEQYRQAIGRYYRQSPGVPRYPSKLEELVKDSRFLETRRHIRRLYPDPMTGKEWGLVRGPDGGIMGIYSQSTAPPLKIGGFPDHQRGFADKPRYSEWKFVPPQ